MIAKDTPAGLRVPIIELILADERKTMMAIPVLTYFGLLVADLITERPR